MSDTKTKPLLAATRPIAPLRRATGALTVPAPTAETQADRAPDPSSQADQAVAGDAAGAKTEGAGAADQSAKKALVVAGKKRSPFAPRASLKERFVSFFKRRGPKKAKKTSKATLAWRSLNRYAANQLHNPTTLRREWFIILGLSLFFLAFYAILLGIMNSFIAKAGGASFPALLNAAGVNRAMWGVSIFCIVVMFAPYLYVGAAFFAGINQIQRSKAVHFVIWSTFIVMALLAVCCLGMLIAGYEGLDAYNLAHNFA